MSQPFRPIFIIKNFRYFQMFLNLHVALRQPQYSTVSILNLVWKLLLLTFILVLIENILTNLSIIAEINLAMESNKCRLSKYLSYSYFYKSYIPTKNILMYPQINISAWQIAFPITVYYEVLFIHFGGILNQLGEFNAFFNSFETQKVIFW